MSTETPGGQETPATRLGKALTAFLGSSATPQQKIDKLYAFLDILDRKASSVCTVNSLLLAANGLLIFRPPPSIDTNTPAGMLFWKGILLPWGVLAVFLSLLTVLYAVFVNSMKWPFLANFVGVKSGEEAKAFDDEIGKLCEVVSERTVHVQRQRFLTLLSVAATFIAVCLICYASWSV